MKELSIEEKAKRYDEAKARINKAYNSNRCTIGFMNEIFPELKESEGERYKSAIRKMYSFLPNKPKYIGDVPVKDIFAWLEKQGEQSQKTSIWKHWRDGICGNGEGKVIYLIKNGYDYSLSSCLCFECDYIELSELDNLMLEKQGEQKVSVVDFKAKDWYASKVDGKIYNAKFMEKTPTNQARKLEIEKAAMSATGIIEQEEWFIKGAEWSDKNPSYISSEKQGGQKSIKVYRVENEAEQKGLWRKFDGTWQPLFDMLTDGKCKDMPMEDSLIYREEGKRWFASAPSKEALQKWFSKIDLEELVSRGFTISEFEVVGYKKISDFEYIFTRDNIINRSYLEVSDIYSEQKDFAPNVEPKFKVGDWIARDSDGFTTSIESIRDEIYYFHQGGNLSVKYVDECFNLWTIQDANDGDVLANWNNTIYLFKGIEEEVVKFYCYYNTNCEKFSIPLDNNSHLGLTESQFEHHPATKKQRNLLFQKMKEAGYEWDAEKKELKKIEEKPAEWNRQSIIDALTKWLTEKIAPLHKKSLDGTINEREEMFKAALLQMRSFVNRPDFQIGKDTSAEWSEEDEKMIESIIDTINTAISECDVDDIGTKARFSLEKERDWLKNRLKSLRPQNRWKPSEEQMEALEHFIVYHNGSTNYAKDLEELRLQLKKLREE